MLIISLFLLRRVKNRKTFLIRVFVLVLILIAASSPFETVQVIEKRESPGVLFIDDRTNSMSVFDEDIHHATYQLLSVIGKPTVVTLKGDGTSLGDTILNYASANSSIVLVSDGNNNQGTTLEDSVRIVSRMGTRVYFVRGAVVHNDLSVEVVGEKSVVVGNENVFTVVVRSATTPADYDLAVSMDGNEIMRRSVHQITEEERFDVSFRSDDVGAHIIKAEIIPSGEDIHDENNVFYKSVYVVEKPKVLFITSAQQSPLKTLLESLYDVDISDSIPPTLDEYLTVVLDNIPADAFTSHEINVLRMYVAEGGGLVVVGGDKAYNFGEYFDSEFESLLPVESKPSTYKGGRSVVILIDVSGSTKVYDILDTEKALAINILFQLGIYDHVGVIAFGTDAHPLTDGMQSLSGGLDLGALVDKITRLEAGGSSATSLNKGLKLAQDFIKNAPGSKHVIIISDGAIESVYEPTLKQAKELQKMDAKMHFVVVKTVQPIGDYAEKLMEEVGGEYYYVSEGWGIDIRFGEEVKPEEYEPFTTYPLMIVDANHFITAHVNLSGEITGFNEVTPKIGSKRLVATANGKPILTVGHYGLGRVASLSTDNGVGWASVLYSEGNSKLISATVNWAIGDPQKGRDVAIIADDTFLGRSTSITIISKTPPKLMLDSTFLSLTRTGENTYTSTFTPTSTGIFYLGDYPIAVNYHIEYRDVGFNNEIEGLLKNYQGGVFTTDDMRSILTRRIQESSIITTTATKQIKSPILILALLIFVGEILVRRFREIRR